MEFLLLFIMFFLGIVAEFNMQGKLLKLKSEQWWDQQLARYDLPDDFPDSRQAHKMYRFDFLVGLILHGFLWSFMILLPLLVLMFVKNDFYVLAYVLCLIGNTAIHAFVSHLMCNRFIINLAEEQIGRIIQILVSWSLFSLWLW